MAQLDMLCPKYVLGMTLALSRQPRSGERCSHRLRSLRLYERLAVGQCVSQRNCGRPCSLRMQRPSAPDRTISLAWVGMGSCCTARGSSQS